jgi:hypothetical protein
MMCAIHTCMLRDDPTGNYALMALPLLVMRASEWMGRTMLQAEVGNRNTSVYPDSNMVVILTVLICDLILLTD